MSESSFNSIDNLIEFGLTISVAQQMMRMLNHEFDHTQAPMSSLSSIGVGRQLQFYTLIGKAPQGPFCEAELNNHILEGRVSHTTLVWFQGLPGWMSANTVPEVNKLFLLIPPTTSQVF
jgi:hypothetical protein